MKTYNWEGVNPDGYFLDKLEPIPSALPSFQKLFQVSATALSILPLPPETELSRQMTTSTTSIDIMGLQAAYANLHTDQERDYFMQRYHDVISSFGGKTSYDAD